MSPPSRRPVSRRATLAAVGASIAGLAGCAGGDPDRGSPTPSRSATPTDDRTATRTPATVGTTAPPTELTITAIDPPETPAPAYPADYRSLLARAARDGGGRLRGVASTLAYAPDPILPHLSRIDLVGDDGVAGRYDVACEGGTYYEWLVGVEEATDEGQAEGEATPVDDLPPERARFVRRVANDSRYVEPQTERGEWVRETFVGGRFALDGTTYRGVELQQTDAAFFSTRAWFALGLLPVGGGGDEGAGRSGDDDVAVDAAVDVGDPTPAVAGVLADVESSGMGGPWTLAADPLPEQVVAFADDPGVLALPTTFARVDAS